MLTYLLKKRLKNGKEHPERWRERMGKYTLSRPAGKILWCHGASVGESLALLPFIKKFQEAYPDWQVLVTTGTVTSAILMEKHLPEKAFHQFSPMDNPKWVKRFLSHWQPDAAIWMESELWPNLIRQTSKTGIPMLLANARMSEKSYANWKKASFVARRLLQKFDAILAQSQHDAQRYVSLLCDPNKPVLVIGNLKWDAEVSPFDTEKLTALQNAIGDRPYWLASSTHGPEDTQILAAHQTIQKQFSDVLTIVLPRHPQRGAMILEAISPFTGSLRSEGNLPTEKDAFYVADTIGETSLFYALCPVVFMGGSFFEHGGQNMLEPAKQGRALLTGPHTFNFVDIMNVLKEHKAIQVVENGEVLGQVVKELFNQNAKRKTLQTAAQMAANTLGGTADKTLQALNKYLEPEKSAALA